MQYRRDIDGLRALAVMPVIFFHAGFSSLSGGFVGVDIFFVISGYLITGIILSELGSDKFSIISFYERRARRILPALFFVIAVSVILGWLWLMPGDMRNFSDSVFAVALFFSNILFWRRTDYFATSSELAPLLHTWSLAVEEQFYVFFPVLLILTWRFARRHMLTVIALLSAMSLGIAQWGVANEPGAAFYLLPTRGWELALGGAIAIWRHEKPVPTPGSLLDQALSALGLTLIAGSIFLFDENTPSPGLAMLAPTVGTGLIILYAQPTTWVARLLGLKPLVTVGLLSYSAYLWHQPLFAFARHRSLHAPDARTYLALSVLSIVLAWLSWRWVERPFRDRTRINRRQVFTFAAAGTLALLVFGVSGHISKGYFWRAGLKDELADLEAKIRINYGLSEHCEEHNVESELCRTTDRPEVILWGDSYAMHLAQGLLASAPNIALVQATRSVCGPILGVAPVNAEYPAEWARDCMRGNDKILRYLKTTPSIKYAVLASPFFRYINGGDQLLLADGRLVKSGEASVTALRQTITTLKKLGITPVLVSPPPRNGTDIGRCLVNASRFGAKPSSCNFRAAVTNILTTDVYSKLRMLESETRIIWLNDAICRSGTCRVVMDDTFIYRDGGHLSHEGSALLGKTMDWYGAITRKAPDAGLASASTARSGVARQGQ